MKKIMISKFNKLSIRTRVTATTVLLLTLCCIGLTIVLNKSAYRMADSIQLPLINNNENREYMKPLVTLPGYMINSQVLIPYLNNTNDSTELIAATSAEEAKVAYKISSVAYMICFIAFGGILTYFITDTALKPLNELSEEMKNKSVENLSNEITLSDKKDEIYDLTLSFNKMTNKLNDAFLMQKRFSNNVAHELRTPLTVMRTNLDVFKKRKNPTQDQYDELIEKMRNQLMRLSELVNSLLSLTNMEDIELSQTIHLKSLLKSICNDLFFIAEQKKVKINITGNEALIKGNYDLIYRAFYNIIENSIKYNYENGSIDINIEKDDMAIITIKDTGLGIPDDMKNDVFDLFFTVDKSRSRKLGGAGIGLSIVKSVIDNHNGNIEITNNSDSGTIFTVKLKSI